MMARHICRFYLPDIFLRIAGAGVGVVAQLEPETGPVDEPVKVVDVRLLEPLYLVVVQPQHLQVGRQAVL